MTVLMMAVVLIQLGIVLLLGKWVTKCRQDIESQIEEMEATQLRYYDEHHKLLVRIKQGIDRLHDKPRSVWWRTD